MRLHFSDSYQSIFKFELANFKRAVGHSFYAGRLLGDTRVCTKCRGILFMLVSGATKLLKLGHSDFDQVYAMQTGPERPTGRPPRPGPEPSQPSRRWGN
jgi:hypothetical protein